MIEKILLVDDEPMVLETLRRQLVGSYVTETAASGREGLAVLESAGPFAVVLSDMRMPEMNGAAFLEEAHRISPDSVRMILSGHAELESAIAAVNLGRIFRFLTKPCRTAELIAAISAGVEQYELVISRREVLEKTLHGTVQVLTEILGLTNPLAQQRTNRIARYAEEICKTLQIPMHWQLQIAVMLSHIGCITLPEELLARRHTGQALSEEAESIYRSHPALAAKLLSGIPRLEAVAAIVSHQLDAPDFSDQPGKLRDWEIGKLGAMILKVCCDLDDSLSTGIPRYEAVKTLAGASPDVPPELLAAIRTLDLDALRVEKAIVDVSQLRVGMVLDEDVVGTDGMRLLSKGHEVTRSILLRLQMISQAAGVVEPFRVSIPQ